MKKTFLIVAVLLSFTALAFAGGDQNQNRYDGTLAQGPTYQERVDNPNKDALLTTQLTTAEEAHLIFMRSEEKLARDVYLTLAKMYPEQPTFYTIATQSEQTHTDTMLDMLIKFNVDDPEPNADDMSDSIGVFESPYFKSYFEVKFDYLTREATTLLSALKVGALIEELDMKDINYCNAVIYSDFPLEEGTPCGLESTDVRALERTLGNLLAGSENHLCAFISQIGPIISPDCYEAQYLKQSEVLEIISDQCPEFSGYVCQP